MSENVINEAPSNELDAAMKAAGLDGPVRRDPGREGHMGAINVRVSAWFPTFDQAAQFGNQAAGSLGQGVEEIVTAYPDAKITNFSVTAEMRSEKDLW